MKLLVGNKGYRLTPGHYRIGRGEHNQIVVDNEHVSRSHGEFRLSGDQLEYRDRGSENGSFLNGRVLPEYVWAPIDQGDTLALAAATEARIFDFDEIEPVRNGPAQNSRGSMQITFAGHTVAEF